MRIFAPAFETNVFGVIAQLVEQRTENPCVPGSIPGGTTKKRDASAPLFFMVPFVAPLFISLRERAASGRSRFRSIVYLCRKSLSL